MGPTCALSFQVFKAGQAKSKGCLLCGSVFCGALSAEIGAHNANRHGEDLSDESDTMASTHRVKHTFSFQDNNVIASCYY